jgi:hypothetical protein
MAAAYVAPEPMRATSMVMVQITFLCVSRQRGAELQVALTEASVQEVYGKILSHKRHVFAESIGINC